MYQRKNHKSKIMILAGNCRESPGLTPALFPILSVQEKMEVSAMAGVDLTQRTIQELFYKQVRDLSMKSSEEKMRSFDMQFSDLWVN